MGENQNLAKMSFPSWGKTGKLQKTVFPCEGKRNNSENWLSPAGERLKMLKIIHRSWATSEKRWKVGLRGVPKGWNSEKQCFGMPRRLIFGENEPSGGPEASKFQKTSFRGIPKLWKFEKQAFGGSRSSENLKNGSSGYPEKAKCDISKRKVLAEDWKRRVLIEYDCLAYYKNTA